MITRPVILALALAVNQEGFYAAGADGRYGDLHGWGQHRLPY